jgi:tyrosyl-tRNA synthetase
VHAFVTPLVTRADGTKLSKTGGGAIWLDAEMMSPYAFYQFWVNADDADVVNYLKYFSFRSHEELATLEKATAERPAAREAQRALAGELTTLVHGGDETDQVVAASQALFGRGQLADLTPATLQAALSEAGLTELRGELPPAAGLFKESGLVASMNEARRTIAEGGAYINNERVADPEATVDRSALLHGKWLVLRRGRRTVAGIELTS